jgi:hypothetical protein
MSFNTKIQKMNLTRQYKIFADFCFVFQKLKLEITLCCFELEAPQNPFEGQNILLNTFL